MYGNSSGYPAQASSASAPSAPAVPAAPSQSVPAGSAANAALRGVQRRGVILAQAHGAQAASAQTQAPAAPASQAQAYFAQDRRVMMQTAVPVGMRRSLGSSSALPGNSTSPAAPATASLQRPGASATGNTVPNVTPSAVVSPTSSSPPVPGEWRERGLEELSRRLELSQEELMRERSRSEQLALELEEARSSQATPADVEAEVHRLREALAKRDQELLAAAAARRRCAARSEAVAASLRTKLSELEAVAAAPSFSSDSSAVAPEGASSWHEAIHERRRSGRPSAPASLAKVWCDEQKSYYFWSNEVPQEEEAKEEKARRREAEKEVSDITGMDSNQSRTLEEPGEVDFAVRIRSREERTEEAHKSLISESSGS